jgi:hypothetical protein
MWYYLAKVGAPLLFGGIALGMVLRIALPGNRLALAI